MPLDKNWRKPRASNANGGCMIVRLAADGANVEVADDKNHPDQGGPILTFTPAEWAAAKSAFVGGEFDQ